MTTTKHTPGPWIAGQFLSRAEGCGGAVMKTPIDWRPITESYLYGIVAAVGNRRAEVVQCYPGEWAAFCWIGAQMGKCMPDEPSVETRAAAKARAERFLRGEITPDLWPAKAAGVQS